MTVPVVHKAAEQAYRLLPDFMRTSDANHNYAALKLIAAGSVALEKPLDFLTIVDPDTSVTGTCELVNSQAAPRAFLGWLGWLLGIDTSVIPDADVRDSLTNASAAQRRGSSGAILNAVQRTLTDSKYARCFTNFSGTEPYLITVITLISETPDEVATLEAAWGEKPAGMDLVLQTVDGATWNIIVGAFDTWADAVAGNETWNDLTTWLP